MKIIKEKIEDPIEKGDSLIYICPECNEILSEMIMGEKCPNCQTWTSGYRCRRKFYQLIKEIK